MQKVREAILGRDEERSDMPSADDLDEMCCNACGLGRVDRLMVFGALFILGWIISWLSFLQLTHPGNFAIFYTFGNILAIIGGMFLSGPCSQLKSMFEPMRLIATLIYLGSMALTLFVAFKGYPGGIVFLCAFIQFLAMIWYFASYLPFGRKIISGCVGSVCGSLV
jgi:hypothetical protein